MTAETKGTSSDVKREASPFAHLAADPEERARILAAGRPFDAAWLKDLVPASPEEIAELEEFLRELEEMRQYNLQSQDALVADLGE